MKHKLGIIVPYRDRAEHLSKFLKSIKQHIKDIDYELIIIEQADNKPFNRGKLLNIGALKARELDCDYIALHDVDMLPLEVDYSWVNRPTHLSTHFISDVGERRELFDTYFGGVTLFPLSHFFEINGYSNNYWGWGYEDDDLLFRCKETFLDYNIKQIPIKTSNSAGLRFNGWDSSVKVRRNYRLRDYTILISVHPDDINCRSEFDMDEYSIMALPGYDTSFSFNAFGRYKFETWTSNKEVISLKSIIQKPRKTILVATHNEYNKTVKFYQDGKLIDERKYEGRLYKYKDNLEFILGQTGSVENKRRAFKGVIDYFAVWNHSLEATQIKDLSENLELGVTENFKGYMTKHCLECALDMKISTNHRVLDVSGNRRDGIVSNCDRVAVHHTQDFDELMIPWRRESKFKLLPHEDNGFYENKWNFTETRKNQLRFYNQVLKGLTNWRKDGIDTLKYKKISDNMIDGLHYISVEL